MLPPSPSLSGALATGLRAASREAWLVAVGLLVAGARRLLGLPALVVAVALVARAASAGLRAAPLDPGGPFRFVADAVTAPRFLALVLGLWLAGALLGAALRVAYLAGALPTLAAGAAGATAGPWRFAAGFTGGFARVLGAALLGLAAELAATLFGAGIGLAALRLTRHTVERGGSPLLAAAVAAALTLAVLVSLLVSALADAAFARAAVLGEGPAEAFGFAAGRVGRRPAAFLLVAMLFSALALAGGLSVQAGGSAFLGIAAGGGLALLGAQAMLAAIALAVAAAVDLWSLGTVAALACAGETQRRASAV